MQPQQTQQPPQQYQQQPPQYQQQPPQQYQQPPQYQQQPYPGQQHTNPMAPQPQKMEAPGDRLEFALQSTDVYVKQKVGFWEAVSQGCCEQANRYDGYAGTKENHNPQPIFTVFERSHWFNRCCCAPNNTLKLEVRFPESPEPQYTIERPGCCIKPCLCCFACTEDCQDEMTLHRGNVQGDVGELVNPDPWVHVQQQSASDSPFNPVLVATPAGATEPTVSVKGPFCSGGCSEACFDTTFYATRVKSPDESVGFVKKLHPTSCGEFVSECCTDADHFQLHFEDGTSGSERAAMFTATFLADFLLFEMDNGMCSYRGANGCYITCFNCYCLGCLCPCYLHLNGKSEGGE